MKIGDGKSWSLFYWHPIPYPVGDPMRRDEVPEGFTYLWRFRIITTPLFGVFVHKHLNPDSGPLHDHPWPFVSVILRGGYVEKTEMGHRVVRRINVKSATAKHKIQSYLRVPSYTLMLVGRRKRTWGFDETVDDE